MQEKEHFLKNMDMIKIDRGLDQHDGDMHTEEISVSDTYCMHLKEINDAQGTSMQKVSSKKSYFLWPC